MDFMDRKSRAVNPRSRKPFAAAFCAGAVRRFFAARLGLGAVLLVAILIPAEALADWFDSNWTHRNAITILPARVPNTDQTDFPVLINRTDPDWRDTFNGGDVGKASGGDILFTAADGTTQLEHEIEAYDPTTGELIAWVKVPTLSASLDTEIYIYYGNASAPDQANPTATWNGDFVGVWHLDEDPSGTAPQLKDRTSNGNHGASEGGMLSTASVSGQVGNGLSFDGSDDLIRILDSTSLDGTSTAATIEVWIQWVDAADGAYQFVMSSSNRFDAVTPDGFEWASQEDGDHFFYPRGHVHENHNLGPNPFTNGVFHHVAATLEYATGQVEIYVDGVPMVFSYEGVPANWTSPASPADWLWGGNPDRPTRYFSGVFDEIRVSDVVRSVDWLQTSINNQRTPDTFYTVGLPETELPHVITGTVFEDVDFAGTAANWDGGSSDIGQPNVDVELYDDGGVYITSVTTDASGQFDFTGLSDGTYRVRVRSSTLGDSDTVPAGGLNADVPGNWPYPLPEMSWAHATSLVGGQDPSVDDTATGDNAGPGDTFAVVAVSGSDVTGLNFGFCYGLIVNTGDDANADNVRSKQGSLRQFIKNSNAISGIDKSWFQISVP